LGRLIGLGSLRSPPRGSRFSTPVGRKEGKHLIFRVRAAAWEQKSISAHKKKGSSISETRIWGGQDASRREKGPIRFLGKTSCEAKVMMC